MPSAKHLEGLELNANCFKRPESERCVVITRPEHLHFSKQEWHRISQWHMRGHKRYTLHFQWSIFLRLEDPSLHQHSYHTSIAPKPKPVFKQILQDETCSQPSGKEVVANSFYAICPSKQAKVAWTTFRDSDMTAPSTEMEVQPYIGDIQLWLVWSRSTHGH